MSILPIVEIILKKLKPKPSAIYDDYWKFAAERQAIFYRRLYDITPLTADPILSKYKFTNAYRAADRVSQYLIKAVIYKHNQNIKELFFRIILFKLFNKVETWELLGMEVGEVSYATYSYEEYNRVLTAARNRQTSIYSGAYIMASGRTAFGYKAKHQNHLKLIELMMNDCLPEKISHCSTMREVYELLISYPSIGEFLAYQFSIDINYSMITNFSEMEFVKAGPGAKGGILKCFSDMGEYSFEDIISLMTDRQEQEFERLDLNFKNLWGRRLQKIDCQNLFCEVDKYTRVAYPEICNFSQRKRIKQKFMRSSKEPIVFFFPPKWNINHLIYDEQWANITSS